MPVIRHPYIGATYLNPVLPVFPGSGAVRRVNIGPCSKYRVHHIPHQKMPAPLCKKIEKVLQNKEISGSRASELVSDARTSDYAFRASPDPFRNQSRHAHIISEGREKPPHRFRYGIEVCNGPHTEGSPWQVPTRVEVFRRDSRFVSLADNGVLRAEKAFANWRQIPWRAIRWLPCATMARARFRKSRQKRGSRTGANCTPPSIWGPTAAGC